MTIEELFEYLARRIISEEVTGICLRHESQFQYPEMLPLRRLAALATRSNAISSAIAAVTPTGAVTKATRLSHSRTAAPLVPPRSIQQQPLSVTAHPLPKEQDDPFELAREDIKSLYADIRQELGRDPPTTGIEQLVDLSRYV